MNRNCQSASTVESTLRVLIRLKSTSQRIDLKAKNAYVKSGFYCVYRTDNTVSKYPLVDLFDIELQPGLLEARSTPALMRVKIHLKGTHLPVELAADSTEHNAEIFTARMPSGAIKLYPMGNIHFVEEDYAIGQHVIPSKHDAGPLESGVMGKPMDETTREAMTARGPVILKLDTPEGELRLTTSQSKIALDFKYLLGLLEIVGFDLVDSKPKCGAEHLLRLCAEGLSGLDKYPEDKLSRWLGFCSGVLQFYEIGCELSSWRGLGTLDLASGTLNEHEKGVMTALFVRYLDVADECSKAQPKLGYAASTCRIALTEIDKFDLNGICVVLGIAQGHLAAAGAIDVDAEREFTRPLLHSLHEGEVPSFSAT